METPHDDPLRQISETRKKTSWGSVAFHQGFTEEVGEEDGSSNLELVSPEPIHVNPKWAARGDPPQRRSHEVSSFPFERSVAMVLDQRHTCLQTPKHSCFGGVRGDVYPAPRTSARVGTEDFCLMSEM
ncbi:MAG: hypothetical protein WCJ18_01960 [Planctomycetota bacterium]